RASAAAGLRAIFAGESVLERGDARKAAAAALEWAVARGVELAEGGRVLLAVDDADRLDGATLLALADLLWEARSPRLTLLVTSELSPDASLGAHVSCRELRGIPLAAADRLVGGPLPAVGPEIEPLYLDELLRWRSEGVSAETPHSLYALVEQRLAALARTELHVLQ